MVRAKKAKTPAEPVMPAEKWKPGKNGVGRIYPSLSLFFREGAGNATHPDGTEYELSTNMGGRCPIIRSSKTGKWFTLSWEDILALAIAAGIDDDDPEAKEGKPDGDR